MFPYLVLQDGIPLNYTQEDFFFFFLIAVNEHVHSTASFHFKFVLNSSGWCGHSNPYTHLWWWPQAKVIVCMNLSWYDGLLQPNNHCPCNNNCWGCRSITASVHEWRHVWRNVIMNFLAVSLFVFLFLLFLISDFCSLLTVETADRPGLLVDLVKIITDINIAVESGEFDTEVWSFLSLPLLFWFIFFPLHCPLVSEWIHL